MHAPTGATGATGPIAIATTAFATNNQQSVLDVVVAGTNIPLPNNQILPAGITVSADNQTFTVAEAGTYLIFYSVTPVSLVGVGSQLVINGVPYPGSMLEPSVTLSTFSGQSVATLPAGSTISLQLFGADDQVTLNAGAGAQLTITKLS